MCYYRAGVESNFESAILQAVNQQTNLLAFGYVTFFRSAVVVFLLSSLLVYIQWGVPELVLVLMGHMQSSSVKSVKNTQH